MRIFQRRSLNFLSGAVALSALALLLAAPLPRRAFRPALPPRVPPASVANIRAATAAQSATFNVSGSRPTLFGPASFNASRTFGPNSFTSTLRGSTPFGPFSFNLNRSFGPNSLTSIFTGSTPFGSANFRGTWTLSGSLNNLVTLTRSLNLSETINGHTANFATSGSASLTGTQIIANVLAHQIRHSQLAAMRQAELASMYGGYGSAMSPYLYAAPGYAGSGYGGAYAMPYAYPYPMPSYGGMGSQAGGQDATPGMQVAGSGANRPEGGMSRLVAGSGLSEEDSHLAWPVGLRSLPGTRPAQLREQVESLLNQEAQEAAAGPVSDQVYRDLTSAVDALRKQLARDREERFSLTYQAYDDAEAYLGQLKQAAKQLVEAGKAAGREARSDKPAGR